VNDKDKPNIELIRKDGSPDIRQITLEIEQAQIDNDHYYQRMERARHVWFSKWQGQFQDGRKHRTGMNQDDIEPFPWDGASDSRLRTVCGIIREHTSISKFAFWNAQIQAKSLRPLSEGRESNVATKMLRWRLYNHMKPELMIQLPLFWNYKWGFGVGILHVEWEQQRRLEWVDISLDELEQLAQSQPGTQPIIMALVDAIDNPAVEDEVAKFIQGLSPILTVAQARAIVKELRETRTARVPTAYPYINRPRWTACRPCVDVLFPSEACDIQQERFVSRREWVSEADLYDRIETDNYDPKFVEEAVKHKGETIIYQWEWWHKYPQKSFRDMIEIHHFYNKAITLGTPCIYKTVFQPLVQSARPKEDLFASFGPFEYQHGQYPFVVGRRTYEEPAILKSYGIAEESYTDEMDIKVQQDGLTDRTSLILQPPMIVPHSRVNVIKNTPLPRAVIGSSRPG
jgi:hypothetical protein